MSMESMYRLLYCIVWPFFNLCHPVRAIGRENLPEGGAVLCANHTALSDPLFICFACTLRNKFRPMAKVELSKVPLIGWLLGKAGVIYVDRGHADVKAVKSALLCLKNHGNLLIFPEGTRVHEGEDVSAKGGAALFATRTRTAPEPLEVIVRDPEDGSTPECTVIWLHGLGADAQDFLTLPQQLREFGAPAARFIFPNAPERELTVRPGYKTRAWYDLLSNDFGSQNEDRQGLAKMHQRISQIINEIVTSGLRAERIFLGGFSMGAAMSLYSSVRQVRTLAGCIALSGYFPAADLIEKDITPAGRGTPVFMAHGAFDSVIPSVLAEHGADLLENTLDTLIWREYNIDHEICPDELMNVAQFMSTALQR